MVTRILSGSVLDRCTDRRRSFIDAEPLLRRAQFLPEADQTLLRAIISGQMSFRQLQPLVGKSAGALARRFNRLLIRLRDPIVIALIDVAGTRDGPGRSLTDHQRRIGLAYFLHRQPATTIARQAGLGYSEVIAALGFVRGWVAATPCTPPTQEVLSA